jgi:hypothetical protein
MSSARSWRVELVIAIALLASSGIWATTFWNRWTARGGQPVFYQTYFEPAVMIACGRGFVISKHQPKPLEDFLFLRADTFDCRELPRDLELDPEHVYQGAWLYLETTVGWAWRVLGISWSGMGPLFGLLFGIDILLAYAICRLAMNRLWALGAASSLAISGTQLINLPHLRDYAKAPFTLALVLIMGLIVTRPVRRRTLLLLAAAYGVVLGIGYGFRTDFLVDLPVLLFVLFAFLDGGLTGNLLLKTAAAAVVIVTFFIVSWPIFSAVYTKGGCQWHVALLGLQPNSLVDLRLEPAPYDFGQAYADGYIDRVVNGYARRMQPGRPPMVFCSHDYDVQSGRYLRDIATTFPADMAIRGYASVIQIVELPFRRWTSPPMEGWFTRLYTGRAFLFRPGDQWGTYMTAFAVLATGIVSLRLGLFLVFFLGYFGGYPAIQFQERHYFHLEFIGWWAIAFVVHQLVTAAWSLKGGVPDLKPLARRVLAVAAAAGAVVALSAGLLGAVRWYQARAARQLFDAYIAAPKQALPNPAEPLQNIAPLDWPQFLEVDLNEAACAAKPVVTFRYTELPADSNFTRAITVEQRSASAGPTRIFQPVFEHFDGVTVSDGRPGCFVAAYRLTNLTAFPLLLGATLPPEWRSLPLHQRLAN